LNSLLGIIADKGFTITKHMISYLNEVEDFFVYMGTEPNFHLDAIPLGDLSRSKKVTLKCRLPHVADSIGTQQATPTTTPAATAKTTKRTKERKIGFIIEKVAQWRKFYNGFTDKNGEFIRLSLEDAAQKVQISKKSLDDYLLQLRFGRKFGFNFNAHKDAKVGVLRAFVKKHKAQQPKLKTDSSVSDFMNNNNNAGVPE